ncbi:leishmanolysin [Algoriphagus boseongensis]|uniref:Leishmanolysin n=1 Tax=Algoriphagus boseongensis TaxID=1442587 RepID=A0A4R6T656_9BACT|nr:leishmanolysin-related zinc metalloendopeptidase [Algoriphagus boseongensis]TDQ18410.1 leishmanolysin [Algoriphagus boseongensis]
MTLAYFTRKGGLIASSIALSTLLFSCSETETGQTDPTSLNNELQKSNLTLLTPDSPIYLENGEKLGQGLNSRATTAPGDDRGRFNISLKFITPVTDRQREIFDEAAARWERIIIKDVNSITGPQTGIPSAFVGFPPVIGAGEVLDDLIIEVAIAPIDGPGRILGQAGPRFYRTSNFLPLTGVMFFDLADLDFLDQLDLFDDVIVHEMGHVLGVGTAWNSFGRELRKGTNTADVYFSGETANKHWAAEGGEGFLPIENLGGQGTRNSHWREGILVNELMTGFINLGDNPLSRITAGSMRDLGYGTAIVGERYELPKGAPGINPAALMNRTSEGINIAEMETLLEPIGFIVDNE